MHPLANTGVEVTLVARQTIKKGSWCIAEVRVETIGSDKEKGFLTLLAHPE
jgi:hypothetical protein